MSRLFPGGFLNAVIVASWYASGAHGQIAEPADAAQSAESVLRRGGIKDPRSDIEAFHNAKMAMLDEMTQVKAKAAAGGSQAQREAVDLWQKRNAVRMRAIQQHAIALANGRPAVESAPLEQADLPANVSAEVKALLAQRVRDYNDQVAADQRRREFPGQADAILKDSSKGKDEGLALQMNLAQSVADKEMHKPFLPAPQIEIPAGVSAEVRALLAERNALLSERTDAQARHPLREGQTQGDWLLDWYQTKSDRLQNLRQKAAQAAEK